MKYLLRHVVFFAPAAVMSAWGSVMLYVVSSGKINELLTPMFRNYVLVAGGLLIALSIAHLLLFQPLAEAEFSLRRQLRGLFRAGFLTLPLLLCAFTAPSTFSVNALDNRTTDTSAAPPTTTTLPPDQGGYDPAQLLKSDPHQPIPIELTDVLQLESMPDKIPDFTSRKVKIVGLYVDSTKEDGTKRLYRLEMWCCAADAKPISIVLDLSNTTPTNVAIPGADVPNGTAWMEGIGMLRYDSGTDSDNKPILKPVLVVHSLKPCPEPDEPYLSPY